MATELQKEWEQKISAAVRCREQWADEFRVKMAMDYYEGRQNPGYPPEEWISIPKIYSHLQSQLPSLYSMDPYFYVKLKKSYQVTITNEDEALESAGSIVDMERMGKVRQSMLNYLKVESKLKTKARLAIQDAHFSYGVLKVRHASDMEEHPNAGEPMLDDDGEEIPDPETGEAMVYPDELPINKRYETLRIHPKDFVFDEDAGTLEDTWGFVAQRIKMRRAEALSDKRFSRSAVRKITPKPKEDPEDKKRGSWLSWRSSNQAVRSSDKDDEYVTLWEIYDLKKNEFLVMGEDAEDLLIKPRTVPPGIEKHPFEILRFTLRDDSPYPIPPVSPAIDPQKEISLSRSRLLTHRKRFNRKYEVDVTRLEDPEEEIAKLEVGDDGTILRVRGSGAIQPIKDAPLDQQNLLELQALDNDIVEALGTPGNARGVANSDSATEASILDSRLEIREGDRMSIVIDWIVEWARKTDQLVQFHIDKDEAVRITGPQGEFWSLIRSQDYEQIQGEFEYSVNVGASRPRLPDIERAQWIAFFSQVVIPFPHILTAPQTFKRMAEMFHIEDEAIIEEMRDLGNKMLSGQLPMPGGQGGGASDNPIAAVMGSALGQQGGNVNGGGSSIQ